MFLSSKKEKQLFKIHVKGYVQGVGFRWNTVKAARNFGIKGFVKNMPDGSVYIEAEGSTKALKDFVEWCKNGPGYVESVTTDTYPPVNYKDFRVEY
jgi:acylphosphatase